LAICISSPAFAQDQGADGPSIDNAVEDIIVTARRTDERLQDVPISITVLSQDQIAKRNIVNPTDLATYTPSLSVNQRYGPEKSSFVLRGFVQEQSTSPSVGVYFADVVVPRVQSGTTSGNTAGAGSFFDLQNVQVLKGPQGTLFGRNTTGGAVLLVPVKPTDKFEGFVEGSAGDYDMWRLQGALNIPLSDTFRVRFSADRMKREGYMKNHSGIGPKDYNDVDYFAARLSIVGELTPDLENYIVASYSRSSNNGYATRINACNATATGLGAIIAPMACDQIARQAARGDGPLDVDVNNPNPYLKLSQWQVINTTTWKATDTLTVKNIASYSQFREKSSFSLNSDNFFTRPSGTPIVYVVLDPAPNQYSAIQENFTEELQLQGRSADDRLTWQAGAYLEISKPLGFSTTYSSFLLDCGPNLQTLQCANPFGFGSVSNSALKTFFNNKGFYAQGTYKITDRLSANAGIRYTIDRTRQIGESTRYTFPAGSAPVRICNDSLRFRGPVGGALVVTDSRQCHNEFVVKSDAPTWLIDLDYKPTDDMLLYAKYSRGYRQGGINAQIIGAETWKPEKVDTYEVGAKMSLRGAVSGYFNVAAFYNNFTNQQITASLTAKPGTPLTGASGVVNAGKSRIWGVEVDSSVRIFENLRVDLGYAYLNTKLIDITPPTLPADSPYGLVQVTAEKGKPLSFSPKNKLTLTGTYTLPLDDGIGEISLAATYVHTDAQNATAAIVTPFYRLPASDIVNLNLDWKGVAGTPVDLSVFVTNVTNEIYPVGVGGGYVSTGFENLFYAPPRMWGVRLRYSFGE
jgi:iron complex outermembrane receptor protein